MVRRSKIIHRLVFQSETIPFKRLSACCTSSLLAVCPCPTIPAIKKASVTTLSPVSIAISVHRHAFLAEKRGQYPRAILKNHHHIASEFLNRDDTMRKRLRELAYVAVALISLPS